MRRIALVAAVAMPALAYGQAACAAGGHYAVDDAEILGPERCHIDVWYAYGDQRNDDFTLQPACNPWTNLELGFGVSRLQRDGTRDTIVELAAKRVFRQLEQGRYGWGMAVTTAHGGALDRIEAATAYLPVSVKLAEALQMNYNLGWAYERQESGNMLWGVGGDASLTPRYNLIAEAYGARGGETELQAGLRYNLPAWTVDVSYGRAWDGADDWVVLGVNWQR